MNLLQAKNKTLQLIREYSNNGAIIGLGDNADYIKSINALISDAQQEISLKRPIIEEYKLPNTPTNISSKFNRYILPSGFKRALVITVNDVNFSNYEISSKEIKIPKNCIEDSSEVILIYEKNPQYIDEATSDTYELEIDEELQYITCYKSASHILIDENQEISQLLKEEYKRLLYNIEPPTYFNNIETSYGGNLWQ